MKLQGRSGENISYFCNECNTTESNPEGSELRAESDIYAPEGVNKVPLASTAFKEPTVGRKPVELKGAFKVLREKGVRFTSYSEGVG